MTNLERRMQHKRLQRLCTKNNQWYSQTEWKDMLNRCDFRCVLNIQNVRDWRRSTGRLFQARGPATARVRSPLVERRVAGTRTSAVDAERSRRRECDYVPKVKKFWRYVYSFWQNPWTWRTDRHSIARKNRTKFNIRDNVSYQIQIKSNKFDCSIG